MFYKDLLDDSDLSNLVPGTIESRNVSLDEGTDGKKWKQIYVKSNNTNQCISISRCRNQLVKRIPILTVYIVNKVREYSFILNYIILYQTISRTSN